MNNQSLPHGWVREMHPAANCPYYVDTKADPPRAIWTHSYGDAQYLSEHPEVRRKTRPLPSGWVREIQPTTNRPYYVDTKADPPRSIWTHPYEDAQYLSEHPEARSNSNLPLPFGWVQKMDASQNRPYYVDTKGKPPRAISAHPYEDEKYLSEHPELRAKKSKCQSAAGNDSKPCMNNIRPSTNRGQSSQQIEGSARQPSCTPQPVCRTVKQLVADRPPLDITKYIHRDPKEHQFPIGVGAGGNVFRGTYHQIDCTTKQTHSLNVVIKCLVGTADQRQKIEERLNREIITWRDLKHPNVSELLGIAYLNSNLPPGLVSRYVLRHDFLAYIGRHTKLKREKAQEIARGLRYLHEKNIVHGDLKVDNVLISDDNHAQITDFGIARVLDVTGFTTMVERNVRYAAPELRPIDITNEEANLLNIRPTTSSDIFSLGILLLQLFHGPDQDAQRGLPYNHIRYNPRAGDVTLLMRIHKGERPRRELYNYIHDQHWRIMEWCWAGNPLKRPGISEVEKTL